MKNISKIERKSWRAGEDNFFKFWKKLSPQHIHEKHGDLNLDAMYIGIFYTFIKFLKGRFTNKEIIGLFFSLMQKHETKEIIKRENDDRKDN